MIKEILKEEITEGGITYGTADEEFQDAYKDSFSIIKDIEKEIKKMGKDQKNNKRDWGYTGSMQKVTTELHEIRRFLRGV